MSPTSRWWRDTTEFDREVDRENHVERDGEELSEADGNHLMAPLFDVFQTFGVSAADATTYAFKAVKDRTMRPVSCGTK